MTNVREMPTFEVPTSDVSFLLKTHDSDNQTINIFEAISSYLENVFPALFVQELEQSERVDMDETASTKERRLIVTFLEDQDVHESENFEEKIEGITYRNGAFSISYSLLMKAFKQTMALFRSPVPVIYKPSKTYEKVLAKLIHLEDNGDFKEFDLYSSSVVERYASSDPDIVAAVTVEQAQCMLYRKNLKDAKTLAKRGYELASYTRFPLMFQAHALLIMSTVGRKKNKLGSCKKYLELAKQNFQSCWTHEYMAHFHECYGSFLDVFIGSLTQPDENVKKHAMSSFRKMNEVASQDTRPRVRDKYTFYALIKSSRRLLDSNSSFGRQERTVSKNDITLAGQYLGIIKKDLWKSIPRGSQIQFRLVESDLYFRQGKFEEGKDLLTQCLHEAKTYGFKTETPIIIQRLQEIEKVQNETISVVDTNEDMESDHQVLESNSNKESGDEDLSDNATEIFTSKYL